MKKSILLSAFFIFGMVSVFTGPFGFSMGMTLDEITVACNGAEPKYIGDDRYYVQPAKSHPLFDGYVVWVSETSGLYYIKGISKEIKTTDYGTEVKQEFSKLLSPLERKYGKFKKQIRLKKTLYGIMNNTGCAQLQTEQELMKRHGLHHRKTALKNSTGLLLLPLE